MLQNIINNKCKSKKSRSSNYKFYSSIFADDMVSILNEIDLTVRDRVLNYQGKIVGLNVEFKDEKCIYVPCYPSTSKDLEDNTELKWVDDESFCNTYLITVKKLNEIFVSSSKRIPCKPVYRIVENGLIVGVLTITNQIVPILPPIQNIDMEDGLKSLKDRDYIVAEKEMSKFNTNTEIEDTTMIKYIHL